MSAGDPAAWEEAEAWWGMAREDIRVVRACLALDPPSLAAAAYHCQQAAEKTVKGLLIAAGMGFRRVHDIDELADLAIPLYPVLAEQLDLCRPLTSWATDFRYPSADQALPPSPRTILEAVATLERLFSAIPGLR